MRGGEWTAVEGGECRGDGAADPAGRTLLLGVVVPDGTYTDSQIRLGLRCQALLTLDAGCEPGNDTGSKL